MLCVWRCCCDRLCIALMEHLVVDGYVFVSTSFCTPVTNCEIIGIIHSFLSDGLKCEVNVQWVCDYLVLCPTSLSQLYNGLDLLRLCHILMVQNFYFSNQRMMFQRRLKTTIHLDYSVKPVINLHVCTCKCLCLVLAFKNGLIYS